MALWKTRQERIGVFTQDQRKLESAIIRLDKFEALLRDALKDRAVVDEGYLVRIVEAWSEFTAYQTAAMNDRGPDVRELNQTAQAIEDRVQIFVNNSSSNRLMRAILFARATAYKAAAEAWKAAANP